MLTETSSQAEQTAVDAVVSQGPRGAFALAGGAAASVVLIWLAFYFLVYLPRA